LEKNIQKEIMSMHKQKNRKDQLAEPEKHLKWPNRIALSVCLTGFVIWSCLLRYKFNHFGYWDWDLSLYSQAMWNLCHGTTYTSLFGTSFLANHAHYFSFFLLPIYYFFQHPLTLVHLNLFSFFAGAFLFFLIAK